MQLKIPVTMLLGAEKQTQLKKWAAILTVVSIVLTVYN